MLDAVFDLWAHRWRKHHAKGDVIIVRYADDFVVGFQCRDEAESFLSELKDLKIELKIEPTPRRFPSSAGRCASVSQTSA